MSELEVQHEPGRCGTSAAAVYSVPARTVMPERTSVPTSPAVPAKPSLAAGIGGPSEVAGPSRTAGPSGTAGPYVTAAPSDSSRMCRPASCGSTLKSKRPADEFEQELLRQLY